MGSARESLLPSPHAPGEEGDAVLRPSATLTRSHSQLRICESSKRHKYMIRHSNRDRRERYVKDLFHTLLNMYVWILHTPWSHSQSSLLLHSRSALLPP